MAASSVIDAIQVYKQFVYKHLHNVNKMSSYSTSSLVSFVYCGPKMKTLRQFKSVTMFHDHNERNIGRNFVGEDFRLPTLPSEVNLTEALRSHCNGIICLVSSHIVILCNPAIGESRTLPKPCLSYDYFSIIGTGFYYDSRANDYKVVRFGTDRSRHDGTVQYKARAEVYSLRTDSWREIGIHVTFDSYMLGNKEVFCKGVFYWCIHILRYTIISFDMFDEVFRSVTLPSNLLVKRNRFIGLAVWNESLALFFFQGIREFRDTIEVWVMDHDYSGGVEGSCSWIKRRIVGPFVDINKPLTFVKNDELLVQATDGSLRLYNLHSQMLRSITSIRAANRYACWEFSYVKSLVSVQGGSQYLT